jgi:hypothetical protein
LKHNLSFEVTGGRSMLNLELDMNSLPESEAQILQKLLFEADFYNIPEDLSAMATPDEFQYVITVKAGNSEHTVRVSDTTMPKSLTSLVNELIALRVTG